MTGLVLKLKPNEKFLVNGVVLQNGPRAARIRIRTAGASVLRLRDALHPTAANTSARRIYFFAQLAVAGSSTPDEASIAISAVLPALRAVCRSEDEAALCEQLHGDATAHRFFSVMRTARRLFALEDERERGAVATLATKAG